MILKPVEVVFAVILFVYAIIKFRKESETVIRRLLKNGVCTMIAYKNGSFWIFDINKEGENITEPEAFEILSLSY